jgi:glucose/arabinose dehydrogenase
MVGIARHAGHRVGGYASRMPSRHRRSAAALTVVAGLLVTGCSFGAPDDGAGGQSPNLPPPTSGASTAPAPPSGVVTVITQGLDVPWAIAFLPDGSALVTERDTRQIKKVSPDGTSITLVQTVDEARPSGEGGLLGIAVSPDYATDSLVFAYYSAESDNRIARFRLGERPQPIVTGIPKSGIHNGGRLAFGPDGFLYASTGDGASSSRSQDLGTLAGKILRMTKDGTPAPGNPFAGSLIWTYGHRNVQGLAWDSRGRMFATEFGQNTWDEINRIEPGRNYGWPTVEGIGGNPSFVDPIQQWATSVASCSGAAIAGDVLVAACLRGQRLWLVPIDEAGTVASPPVAAFVNEYGRLRAATTAPDGSIWVSTSNLDGRGQPRDGDDKILRVVIDGEGIALT